MDTRTVLFLVLFAIFFKMSWGKREDRLMSECWNAGIKCSNHSACNFDTVKNNLTCFCVAGFMGDLCEEDRNECDLGSAPCRKRGVCHNSIGSFRCDCLPGWVGSHCEHSDGSGQSVCVTGYTGVNCTEDFDECTQWKENPCEHGSTCVNIPGNFSCSCAAGWEGRICNEDIDECSLNSSLCNGKVVTGNCTNIPGGYRCDCPYPYTGLACNDVSSTTPTTTSTTTTSTTPAPTSSILKQNYSPIGTGTTLLSPSQSGASTKKGNVVTPFTPTRVTPIGSVQPSSPGRSNLPLISILSPGHSSSPVPDSSPASNSTPAPASRLQGNNGDGTGGGGGGSNGGAIAGAIVGVLVVCGAVGAGVLVYHKYFRKPQKIGNTEETTVDKCEKELNEGDTNKNTKWKPSQDSVQTNDVQTNGVNVTSNGTDVVP